MTTPKAKFAGLALIAALGAGFTLGLTAPAWADLDEGLAAYQRGDYAAAIREWRPLAKQGVAEAQYNLGIMYRIGQGVPPDYAKAVGWWHKAAEQGVAEAQHNLGLMYYNGRGVPQDYGEAIKWFRKAAEQGMAKAQFYLGVMYDIGQGVPQDYAKAMKWYRKAADQGKAEAQNNLGATPPRSAGANGRRCATSTIARSPAITRSEFSAHFGNLVIHNLISMSRSTASCATAISFSIRPPQPGQ